MLFLDSRETKILFDIDNCQIWISPIVTNIEDGYHGYWAKDLYSINSHFGTEQDLKDLSDALHRRGMFLMVDVVVNHMGFHGM